MNALDALDTITGLMLTLTTGVYVAYNALKVWVLGYPWADPGCPEEGVPGTFLGACEVIGAMVIGGVATVWLKHWLPWL